MFCLYSFRFRSAFQRNVIKVDGQKTFLPKKEVTIARLSQQSLQLRNTQETIHQETDRLSFVGAKQFLERDESIMSYRRGINLAV